MPDLVAPITKKLGIINLRTPIQSGPGTSLVCLAVGYRPTPLQSRGWPGTQAETYRNYSIALGGQTTRKVRSFSMGNSAKGIPANIRENLTSHKEKTGNRRGVFYVADCAIMPGFVGQNKNSLGENYVPTFVVVGEWPGMLNSFIVRESLAIPTGTSPSKREYSREACL